nr:39S ribosomal protein L34, mitochondrial [Camelus dromedarius]
MHAHAEEVPFAYHLLVHTPLWAQTLSSEVYSADVELQLPEAPAACVLRCRRNYVAQKSSFRTAEPTGFGKVAAGQRDTQLDMAFFVRSVGRLLGPVSRSAALLGDRWLQPQAWLGLPDAWGHPAMQQTRGKARGNEYQPSNIKRKHKHGWIRRLSTPAGVQVILRRMHKGRKSLSH